MGIYWQNFVNAWTEANMGDYLLNSVVVTAMALALLLIISIPCAYILARMEFRGSSLYRWSWTFSDDGRYHGAYGQAGCHYGYPVQLSELLE